MHIRFSNILAMDWLTRVVIVLSRTIMDLFSLPFLFYYNFFTKQEIIPPIKNKLLLLSVTELLCKMRCKEIKSVEIVSAYINRIKEVNPFINAVAEDRFNAAIKEAELADKIRNDNEMPTDEINKKYPLLGIPFTVKQSIGLKGLSQSSGLVKFANSKAKNDASTVERMKKAGAIPLVTSVSTEFCNNLESYTALYGRCRNPYDLRRSVGGSSSGEATLNGAGASLFGTASDLCGSIRLPCSFNCVYGHKPTAGMVTTEGHFPNIQNPKLDDFMQLGIITRFATDLDLLLKISLDEQKQQLLKFDRPIDVKKLKIFYMNEVNLTPFFRSKDIKNSLDRVLSYFRSMGHEVKKFESNEVKFIMEILFSVVSTFEGIPSGMKIENEVSDNLNCKSNIAFPEDYGKGKSSLLTEFVKSLVGLSQYSLPFLVHEFFVVHKRAILFNKEPYWLERGEKLKMDLLNILNDDTIIIMPTVNELPQFPNMIIRNLAVTGSTFIWNIVGCPATHIPLGLNSEGLPLGIQVIAAPYHDRTCIAVAKHLEQEFGGWREPQLNN